MIAQLCVLLLLGAATPWTSQCTEAAPWDGIVGFLRFVSELQDRRPDPVPSSSGEQQLEDQQPLREIVYSVEEQVAGDGRSQSNNASVIIYDSLRDRDANATILGKPSEGRAKRSSDATASESGRVAAVAVVRPFLIGRKLWYVPLWFSLYLILYILALVVKSVARHRIKYPTLLSEDDALAKRRNGYGKADSLSRRVSNGISNAKQRYQRQWSM